MNDLTIRNSLQCVDPRGIICSDRLDVIVRYILFKEIAYNRISDEVKSLYNRTILSRSGAVEQQDFFSLNEKSGIDAHIEAAKQLFESIKNNGFDEQYYVPMANDLGLYNGAHRIAASLALNEPIWIRSMGEHGIKDMGFEWFVDNGFETDDRIRVLRGFADVHDNCGIYILYGTVQEKWKYIETQIGKELKIVGTVDLDFSDDYLGFENLIQDIYEDYDRNSVIGRKIDLLKFATLIVRVILVSDEKLVEKSCLYKKMISIKEDIREKLKFDFPNDAYITLHGTDSKEEFDGLKQVVLSVNNIRYLRMRGKTTIRSTFTDWITDFRDYCKRHNINTDDVCIVGSSPLEVLDIRNSTDIDIVVAPELRNVYGDGVTHLTPTLDIGTRNYVRNYDEVLITDEQLIFDDNQHFMFMGLKFANIESVFYRKSHSDRKKDKDDVKRIEIFMRYYKHFSNRSVLQQQIKNELKRRGLDK